MTIEDLSVSDCNVQLSCQLLLMHDCDEGWRVGVGGGVGIELNSGRTIGHRNGSAV